jgi:Histidine kinase/Histidine kinase-, DNA gyrase B-, and HSP90-like ATPase
VKDIELQSTILTAKDIHEISKEHEIPKEGKFGSSMSGPPMQPTSAANYQQSKTRPRATLSLSILGLLLWTVGVFFYNVNDFFLFDPEAWWFGPPTINSLINDSIGTLNEQWIAALALGVFSFTPLFRRAIHDRLLSRDELKLFFVFAGLQAIFLAQIYYEYTHELSPVSYGVFLVVIAGLLGGARLGLQFGLFHALSGAAVFYFYVIMPESEDPASFLRIFLTELHILVPIWVGWIAGYIGEHRGQRRFSWLTLLLLGFTAEFAIMFCTIISSWAPSWYFQRFTNNFFTTPLLLLAFSWLVYYHQSFSSSTLKMTQTELALAEAELKALRAQINPHFMLNSLSVIHHLVRTQPETARALLLDLSDLFQHTLRAGDFVPLRQELEHVRAYLALEQARLTKRLNVMWAVLAEDKLDTPVPTLILQPIVENAIVHGIAPKSEGGTLSILVKQSGDDLHIQVVDNGVGFDTSTLKEVALKGHSEKGLSKKEHGERERPSIGVQNIDLRLRLLYGEAYRLQMASTPGAGTTVELKIPVTSAPVLEPTRDLVKV